MSPGGFSTTSGDVNERVSEYRTPAGYRIGDAALLLTVATLGAGALIFLLMLPVTLLRLWIRRSGGTELSDASVALIAGSLAVVVLGFAAFAIRPWVAFWIRLEPTHLKLGGLGWPALIPYDDVEFIQADPGGGQQMSGRAHGSPVKGTIFLIVEATRHRWKVVLDCQEAESCLRELLRRSRYACAIDSSGHDYLPTEAAARPRAHRRLARAWLVSGGLSVFLGVVGGLGASAMLISDRPANPGLQATARDVADRLRAEEFLSWSPALIGWGLFSVRRGREHLRALRR